MPPAEGDCIIRIARDLKRRDRQTKRRMRFALLLFVLCERKRRRRRAEDMARRLKRDQDVVWNKLVIEGDDIAILGQVPHCLKIVWCADYDIAPYFRCSIIGSIGQKPDRNIESDRGLQCHPGKLTGTQVGAVNPSTKGVNPLESQWWGLQWRQRCGQGHGARRLGPDTSEDRDPSEWAGRRRLRRVDVAAALALEGGRNHLCVSNSQTPVRGEDRRRGGYSVRSVTAGSMRPARHAGTIIATVPNATRRMVMVVITLASNGRVSYSSS